MKFGYFRRNFGQAEVDAPTLQRLAAKADVTHTPVLDDGEAGAPGRWITLQCKATDEAFNTQPESPKGIWNLRGILNNSWHTVRVKLPKCNHPDCVGLHCCYMPLADEKEVIDATRCKENFCKANASMAVLAGLPEPGGTHKEFEANVKLYKEAIELHNPSVLLISGPTVEEMEEGVRLATEALEAAKRKARERESDKKREKAWERLQKHGGLPPAGTQQKTRAAPPPRQPARAAALPEGWVAIQDKESGKVYYHNEAKKMTTWTRPE